MSSFQSLSDVHFLYYGLNYDRRDDCHDVHRDVHGGQYVKVTNIELEEQIADRDDGDQQNDGGLSIRGQASVQLVTVGRWE